MNPWHLVFLPAAGAALSPDFEAAPRDQPVEILSPDGDWVEAHWEPERWCMIGPPQGSYGPGFVDDFNRLPIADDMMVAWRLRDHNSTGEA